MSNVLSRPTAEEAVQFAVMLDAGLPPESAIRYFYEAADSAEIMAELARWLKSTRVRRAAAELAGKSWTDMTLEERIDASLSRHYNGLAWFLFSTNYANAGQNEKGKLDTARTALEAKKAGQAGRGDPLTRFFDDLNSGKIKLSNPGIPVRTAGAVLEN